MSLWFEIALGVIVGIVGLPILALIIWLFVQLLMIGIENVQWFIQEKKNK